MTSPSEPQTEAQRRPGECVPFRGARSRLAPLGMAREFTGVATPTLSARQLRERPGLVTSGVDIHFVHVKSHHEDALPLMMAHGWPGSVISLLETVGPLTDPTAYGAHVEDAFDLVLPSLPASRQLTPTPGQPGVTPGGDVTPRGGTWGLRSIEMRPDVTSTPEIGVVHRPIRTPDPSRAKGSHLSSTTPAIRRLLANGHCTRPRELDCRFQTICEGCGFFQTDAEFVPILRRQRDDAAHHGDHVRMRLYDELVHITDEQEAAVSN
jgi:Epoxide hydrolase N terminus